MTHLLIEMESENLKIPTKLLCNREKAKHGANYQLTNTHYTD